MSTSFSLAASSSTASIASIERLYSWHDDMVTLPPIPTNCAFALPGFVDSPSIGSTPQSHTLSSRVCNLGIKTVNVIKIERMFQLQSPLRAIQCPQTKKLILPLHLPLIAAPPLKRDQDEQKYSSTNSTTAAPSNTPYVGTSPFHHIENVSENLLQMSLLPHLQDGQKLPCMEAQQSQKKQLIKFSMMDVVSNYPNCAVIVTDDEERYIHMNDHVNVDSKLHNIDLALIKETNSQWILPRKFNVTIDNKKYIFYIFKKIN